MKSGEICCVSYVDNRSDVTSPNDEIMRGRTEKIVARSWNRPEIIFPCAGREKRSKIETTYYYVLVIGGARMNRRRQIDNNPHNFVDLLNPSESGWKLFEA